MIDLYDPAAYVDGPPHAELARLRDEDPVHRVEMPDGTWYWAVLRHADVVAVSRRPEVFSAAAGGVVLEDLEPEMLARMQDMLLAMDPPRHTEHRRNIAPRFTARVIATMEDRIRVICRSILDEVDAGQPLDFVHQVAARLPAQVVGELMGIPRRDWPELHAMAERNSGGQDPDINPDERGSSSIEMARYAVGFAGRRRGEARTDDLTDLLLHSEVDGRPMTDAEFGSFFVQLVTAGNDTTRTMLSSGLAALLDHPDQFDALRQDPSGLPVAFEEILRWANPLHYFRRTVIADTELAGIEMAVGDKVAMIYTSANRDETVFERAQDLDTTRDPNPHLSFGLGTHFCLGAHLARLEARVFFEELFERFGRIEQVGPALRQRSNLNNSLKSLPVVLDRS